MIDSHTFSFILMAYIIQNSFVLSNDFIKYDGKIIFHDEDYHFSNSVHESYSCLKSFRSSNSGKLTDETGCPGITVLWFIAGEVMMVKMNVFLISTSLLEKLLRIVTKNLSSKELDQNQISGLLKIISTHKK